MRAQPALPGLAKVTRRRDPAEAVVLAAILKLSALWPDVLLHRNNTGSLRDRTGRPVRFGLGEGSPDLVGSLTVAIGEGPDHLIARAIGLEVKTVTGRLRPAQVEWHELHRSKGWAIAVVRSAAEAQRFIEDVRSWKI